MSTSLRRPGWLYYALAFAGLLFVVWLRLHQPPNTVDDAYITFRYARNLATGVGFVYNAGDRVLGTTTPGYAMLLAALSRLTGFYDYPRLALMTNALLDALGFCLIARLAARLNGGWRWVGLGAGLLRGLEGRALDFSTGGMEASFNLFAIGLTLLLFVENRTYWMAAALGLALLVRPDSVTLAAALFGVLALEALRRRRPWPWREALITATVVAPWLLFAFAYFGQPIPQSILAKSELYRTPELMAFRAFLVQARTLFPFSLPPLRDPEPLYRQLLQAVLPGGLAVLGLAAAARRRPRAWAIGLYMLGFMAFYSVGNPLWLGWYEIPMAPLYHVLILTAVVAVGTWAARRLMGERAWQPARQAAAVQRTAIGGGGNGTGAASPPMPAAHGPRAQWVVHGLALLTVAVMTLPHLSRLNALPWEPRERPLFVLNPAFNKRREEDYTLLAQMLKPAAQADRLVAIPEIGAFGYSYPGRLFDTSGLISPPALRYFPIPEHIPVEIYSVPREMIFDLEPDLFIAFDSFMQVTLPPRDPEFLQRYIPTIGMTSHAAFGVQRLMTYRRAGLPMEVTLPPDATPAGIRFSDENGEPLVTLEGYRYRPWADQDHDYVEVTLFWRGPEGAVGRDLLARVNLLTADGQLAYQVLDYPGEQLFPTAEWTPNMWLVDRYLLVRPVPEAGPYRVAVTVFTTDSDFPLAAGPAGGARLPDDTVIIDNIAIGD